MNETLTGPKGEDEQENPFRGEEDAQSAVPSDEDDLQPVPRRRLHSVRAFNFSEIRDAHDAVSSIPNRTPRKRPAPGMMTSQTKRNFTFNVRSQQHLLDRKIAVAIKRFSFASFDYSKPADDSSQPELPLPV
ncbi:hypothetical protein PMAYCL1PPCAC_30398, partial [Pristionchus mayeri]